MASLRWDDFGPFAEWLDAWRGERPQDMLVSSGARRGREPVFTAHGVFGVQIERIEAVTRRPVRVVIANLALTVGSATYVVPPQRFRSASFSDVAGPSWFWQLDIELFGQPSLEVTLFAQDPAFSG